MMGELKDEFKWFGEGFDGFPKRLPEDCIEYTLYLLDSNLCESITRNRLRDVQAAANKMTRQLLQDFVWQRDGFALELCKGKGMLKTDCHFSM